MCLGIPGQIVAISDPEAMMATINVCGIKRQVNVACVAEGPIDALIGKWALVHVGFAMSRIDEEEAKRTIDLLNEMGEVQAEIQAMRQSNTS